ncbi:MAG: amidohydrolase family protein [Planctomycetota bacterium]
MQRPVVLVLAILGVLTDSIGPRVTAQTTPRVGIEDRAPQVYALRGLELWVTPHRQLSDATVVVRDGRIEAVGAVEPPPDAVIVDLSGCVATAGWIDLDVRVELAPAGRGQAPTRTENSDAENSDSPPSASTAAGRYWNDFVRPERSAADWVPEPEQLRQRREAGFVLGLVSPADKVFSGTGAIFAFGDDSPRAPRLQGGSVASFGSFARHRDDSSSYPGSRMGAMALLRQAFYDAQWYQEARAEASRSGQEPPDLDLSLAALAPVLAREMPWVMRVSDPLEFLRAIEFAQEFGLSAGWYAGSGTEFTWLDLLVPHRPRCVIPVAFPRAPVVDLLADEREVSLRALELWARAPENPARLERAGLEFALTPRGLDAVGHFGDRVHEACDRGLSRAAALAAVTTVPAAWLGRTDRWGTIEPGKAAHLTILDGQPFAKGVQVREVWIDGVRYPRTVLAPSDLRGQWLFTVDAREYTVTITGSPGAPKVEVAGGDGRFTHARMREDAGRIALVLSGAEPAHTWRSDGTLQGGGQRWAGLAAGSHGPPAPFEARRRSPATGPTAAAAESPAPASALAKVPPGRSDERLAQPLGARGRLEAPVRPRRLRVRGAQVWTCGPQGLVPDGEVLIENGKIVAVGREVGGGAVDLVVDVPGSHITPGLVDAHSHTAIIGGVNEATQAVTSEVRIRDVIDPDDINIYRQLAGGVTAAQLLHGSANPIGGQAATIKLRWGEGPERLLIPDAKPTIKFALGENVKQSNWGDGFVTRYPQTRMGVEQILRDSFAAARAYQRATGKPQRRDLELEALVEILEGKRWIHCHSYRQDEILALLRIAEDFGFRVGTFQHVLEGYKVAPEMARHGAGGSSFSDWWAYKFEVYDAIPHNGALLHRAGVTTSFNSDSDELARRLNTEAAKAVKYGGVAREEALCFVTLNPARQLGIEHRVGSLEPGKDADFVIWSGDPLSTYSVCLETWIDGARYFSRAEEAAARRADEARRGFLIQRALEGDDAGGATGKNALPQEDKEHYQCCPR